ncbi:hypothetical protein HII28_09195 [Planctomonas sp. JC2975]|uniref:FtsX-like permease family protein n=1 Tax=Planctomonas sp. JC2975 TaxID=2729626 RepID=UPI0014752C65|nr:FtsX-like permease family protein [Planctomonas sp. JC2975]NNC12055.1 hypothetical protein [Planctomonas sp. JC2975]
MIVDEERDGVRRQTGRSVFWIGSVRRRPASFVWLLALSTIAMVVSVLAPMLVRAVDEATLAQTVQRAGAGRTAIVAASDIQTGSAGGGLVSAEAVTDVVHSRVWGAPFHVMDSSTAYSWVQTGGHAHGSAAVAAPATTCGATTFVSGRCPVDDGEVAVAKATAGTTVKVGASLELDAAPAVTLKVVGIYDDRRGTGAVLKSPSQMAEPGDGSAAPDLVVTRAQFEHLRIGGTAYSLRLLNRTVTLDDLPGIRADIQRAQDETLTAVSAANGTRASSGLLGVVDALQPQQGAAATLLAVLALEALGLAWFAEALLVQRIGRDRAAEWGLARLRGLPRRRHLASVFVEPTVAVVAGSVIGAAIGIGSAQLAVTMVLGPGVRVDPLQPLVIGAAALTVVGSLVALVAASVRSARLPLSVLLRETAEPRTISRPALIGQTAIVLLALVVIYSLVSQTSISGPQVTLLAPAVVAVLIGIVGLRLAIALIRRVTRKVPRSLNGLLVGRRLSRTPSALYVAVMVTMGLAVVTYSAQTAVVADRLQDQRAAASLGASEAVTVSVPSNVDFLQSVRRADPSGTQAMAVELLPSRGDAPSLIAVDASRLAAVSSWDPAWGGSSAAALRAKLSPPTGASMKLTGTRISIGLARVSNVGDEPPDQTGPFLMMVVQNASGWHDISFGAPRDGTLVGAIPCSGGCRVVWLGESRDGSDDSFATVMTITGFSTDTQPASRLSAWLDPDKWRNRIGEGSASVLTPGAVLRSREDGLGLEFTGAAGSTASIAPQDAPEPLPAVVGPSTDVTRYPGISNAFVGAGPDQSRLLLQQVQRAHILPGVLGDGAMVDLAVADKVADPARSVASHEVWLSPGAHPQVMAALARDRIHVTGTTTLSSVEHRFASEAAPRSAQLGLAVGAGALLLLLLGVIAIRIVGAPGRRRDTESLRIAGVPERRLRAVAFIDMLVPIGLAVVLGAAAGVVAFALTVPHLPLTRGDGAVPPPDYSVAPVPLALTVVGVLVLVAVVAWVSARLELRVRRPR